MKSIVKKEYTEILRIKLFESVFSIIPCLLKLNHLDDIKGLKKHIFVDCNLKFIFVSNINKPLSKSPNISNKYAYTRHQSLKDAVKSLNRMKHEPFNEIVLCDEDDFKNSYLTKFKRYK
ncbi:hypothetical protein [Methanobrevibacter filiformis]|uniref:Uncharacterized protein n=1 Tax=Methanobrevibacter filiformis TaxID=55758 RepID=A0A165Z782_9EURY|nr:hypothetical protein [Methanobrevibacter filiformis]KZX10338.1 hypothetical protein MBFIL_17910 [Methanobrevibacter filiformis]